MERAGPALHRRRPADIGRAEARRLVLTAQGFGARPHLLPHPAEDTALIERALRKTVQRLGVVQLDAVNVVTRSHYLPFFSRLGPYPRALLDQAVNRGKRRPIYEYWAHEASLLPVELYPLFGWRREAAAEGQGIYRSLAAIAREQPDYVAAVREEIRQRGPLSAGDLAEPGQRSGPWWGWTDGKRVLEYLFWAGEVTTGQRRNFERLYDLPERCLPARVLAEPIPDRASAQRHLLRIALGALGVAAEADLRDYFRLPPQDARARLAELVEAGEALPVGVEGWKQPAFLDPAARWRRRIEARALLSPFDSLVWDRPRTERLWDFRYRLELYTPGPKRQFGYYVLPFLLGERLVARVDVKADRQARILRVPAAHLEAGEDPAQVAGPLHDALVEMAQWLELDAVVFGGGDLAPFLEKLAAG